MIEREKFAVLRRARRVWAVAAVHGEAERLARLHDEIADRFEHGDRIVYLGNVLGRGPAIRETLEEVLTFRLRVLALPGAAACDVAYLRGSQEEMWQKLLQIQFAQNPSEVLTWMLSQGVGATLAAYGGTVAHGLQAAREGALSLTRWTSGLRAGMRHHPGHEAWVASLRRAAMTAEGTLLFVHAGIDPTRPLAAQSDSFWWGGGDLTALAEPFEGFRRVIRGFDRHHPGIAEGRHAATIDGGCGFGGPLLAACLAWDGTLMGHVEG